MILEQPETLMKNVIPRQQFSILVLMKKITRCLIGRKWEIFVKERAHGLSRQASQYFRVRAALFDHTARGVLSPPHTLRRWHRQLRDMPYTHGNSRAALRHRQDRGTFGKPIQEGVPGLQRGPRDKLLRPTYSIFRDDCHLPAMIRLTGGYAR